MNPLISLLENQYGVLFIAPPGWGKTRMLLQMIASHSRPWIFISPLRALANEFYLATVNLIPRTYLVNGVKDFEEIINNKVHFRLLIVTPEVFNYSKIQSSPYIIWDEFHLNYYWGDTFRHTLAELYYQIASQQVPLLKLTATMSEKHLSRWHSEMQLNYEKYLCINIANQCLKNLPQNFYFYPGFLKRKLWENLELDLSLSLTGTTLLFCAYRQQVDRVASQFKKKEFTVLSCKGGETKDFGAQLMEFERSPTAKLDLIVATTAVSHGVNLPEIHRIYFAYPVKNRDFWIQMVGRGGRKGECFQVHTMDFEPECGRKIKAVGKSIFYNLRMRVRRVLCLLKALL